MYVISILLQSERIHKVTKKFITIIALHVFNNFINYIYSNKWQFIPMFIFCLYSLTQIYRTSAKFIEHQPISLVIIM